MEKRKKWKVNLKSKILEDKTRGEREKDYKKETKK